MMEKLHMLLKVLKVIDENCNIINLTNEELDFGYRSSLVMKKGYIVLSAVFKIEKRASKNY